MIIFFYFEETVKTLQNEFGFSYEHKFEKVPDVTPNSPIPFEKIYFSTPSDFRNHIDNIKSQAGESAGKVHIVRPQKVVDNEDFPKHIGFQNFETLDEFKGRPSISIAILNAMSNALGDHLIGMQAFDYWQEKIQEHLPGTQIEISFYQLNPYRVGSITKQWHPKFNQVFMLPNRLSRFVTHDAFVDLGTLLLRENFDTQPMIDFFFEALSIDPNEVPKDKKRINYKLQDDTLIPAKNLLRKVRSKGRPILLFHHKSTSPIRGMSDGRARSFISKVIKETDYFVVSACGLEYQNDRFLDLSKFSNTFDEFATIISLVDAIITVDTSTYHIADAFDIPTVALFTTINPDFRSVYYPHVEGIALEEKDGDLYGRHKASKKEEKAMKEIAYVDKKWEELKTSDVLEALEKAKA